MRADQAKEAKQKDLIDIGLIGCGRLAEFGYLPAFKQAAGVRLAGVADINPSRCKDIAPGIPAYESSRALIRAGVLDAVVISTPTRFHLADARCAAEAGLPALVEKPPGLTVGEASALQALEPSPWIAFNRRFELGIAGLKEKLPRQGKLYLRLELHYRRHAWRSFDMQDDLLLDLGPHLIDLARWFTDSEILWARAHSLKEHRVQFELGLDRGNALIACSNNRPHCESIDVRDSLGRLGGSYKRGGLVSGIVARLLPYRQNPLVSSLVRQLEAFGRAVRKTRDVSLLATPSDGLVVMSTIEAVRQSAAQGGAKCSLPPLPKAN
jgi:predicted dehydrogenase